MSTESALRSITATVVLLFVTAQDRRLSSFSSPLALPNHLYYRRDPRHLGGDDFPSLKLLTYHQKLYKCFGDVKFVMGQIRCALHAGYLPAFPDGLTPPSGLHRLNGLFQGERDWLYLPVALEGNHSAWRLLADGCFVENYLLHEPKEDGKHILVIFGPATEARFGLSFRELELLWKGRRFEDCVEQMKELGQLFLADNKEVIYVILVDGVLDWVEKWMEEEAEGAEASHVFKIYKELYEDEQKELEQAREENERLKMELAKGGVGEEMVTGWMKPPSDR
ncbi:unnamed protein product [Vitrella brassicaformis CCMP3155]|uniref:Uncharacterized protein n=1 Tax=Vitrella brassicaformis (strain CCMP3155) TaxID=1169540 RepID=A0A0G4FZM1_VITBC|nr:unnamed protein product [Vitrella brassicaformis CCMP3155]|eukprot:CEM21086.1 unnamed protein product [Vitrella brassicaformis CCMP3155]